MTDQTSQPEKPPAQTWDTRNRLFGATEAINDTFRDWLHGIAEDFEMRQDMDRLEDILSQMRLDPKLTRP